MNIKKGPWRIVGTKIVYRNPWIKVREDKVIRPDSKNGIFGVVELREGVSVIPLDTRGNVYLTQEYHYAVERITIEAISGGINKGENKLKAAQRELKEETGFTAKKWTYLGVIDPFTSMCVSPNHIYLAEQLIGGRARREGTETMKITKIPYQKALEMVMKSKITHGASCVALLKIYLTLKTRKII